METGDPLVDRQHREIHQLVDDAEAASGETELLMGVLDRLMEHVDCHFATEEALMARTGYAGPLADAHVAEHRDLTNEARTVVLKVRLGEVTAMEPVAEFLRAWLVKHVERSDQTFIEYVRSHDGAASLPEPWASHPPELDC
jgi:hemerythrin-like metal-binding protein